MSRAQVNSVSSKVAQHMEEILVQCVEEGDVNTASYLFKQILDESTSENIEVYFSAFAKIIEENQNMRVSSVSQQIIRSLILEMRQNLESFLSPFLLFISDRLVSCISKALVTPYVGRQKQMFMDCHDLILEMGKSPRTAASTSPASWGHLVLQQLKMSLVSATTNLGGQARAVIVDTLLDLDRQMQRGDREQADNKQEGDRARETDTIVDDQECCSVQNMSRLMSPEEFSFQLDSSKSDVENNIKTDKDSVIYDVNQGIILGNSIDNFDLLHEDTETVVQNDEAFKLVHPSVEDFLSCNESFQNGAVEEEEGDSEASVVVEVEHFV